MILRPLMLLFSLMGLSACHATLSEAGRAYFRQGNSVKGVEPADALVERMKNDQELRDITYGPIKSARVVQCTFLRNQLYVASMKKSVSKELMDAVKLMESAYQENDKEFLAACDQIGRTELGKTFISIQNDYLIKKNNE